MKRIPVTMYSFTLNNETILQRQMEDGCIVQWMQKMKYAGIHKEEQNQEGTHCGRRGNKFMRHRVKLKEQ